MNRSTGRDRLAVALDLPLAQACSLYALIAAYVGYAKVGLSLFVEHGPNAVELFRKLGAKVFLDLKLHDIPNTVELAAERAASLGIDLLSVHSSGGASMLRAAQEGVQRGADRAGVIAPKVLAVTVLTSLSQRDLSSLGVGDDLEQLVLRLARIAVASGVEGLVCSAREVSRLRRELGERVFLCTPGIRLSAEAADDQSRTDTPRTALDAGSNLLVVGRPIYTAADPVAAAKAFAREAEVRP